MKKLIYVFLTALLIGIVISPLFAQTNNGSDGGNTFETVRVILEIVLVIVTTIFGERWYKWYNKANEFSNVVNSKIDEFQGLVKKVLKDLEDRDVSQEEFKDWLNRIRGIFHNKLT